jgi:hypothetical protein
MLLPLNEYQPGDVLVQSKGQPWVFAANLVLGHPYPHAAMVHSIGLMSVYILQNSYNGIHIEPCRNLDQFEVWRPLCDDETKRKAITWMEKHCGEMYGYDRLAELVLGYREGWFERPGMDDDPSQDGRRKVCSETIALAYYRAGYDLVPDVDNRDTMPFELRNPARLVEIRPSGA